VFDQGREKIHHSVINRVNVRKKGASPDIHTYFAWTVGQVIVCAIAAGIIPSPLGVAAQESGSISQAPQPQTQPTSGKKTAADYIQEGDEKVKQKQDQAAIAAYQSAIALLPKAQNTYDLWIKLGSLWVKQNNVPEALNAFVKGHGILRQLNPADYPKQVPLEVYAYGNVAQEFLAQNQKEAALKAYRQAVSLNPDLNQLPQSTQEAWVYLYVGDDLRLLQQLPEAMTAYRQAVTLAPTLEAALNALGTLLQQQNQLEEAIALYKQWVSVNSQSQAAKSNLINAERLLKQQAR
jgi:tetratricopeptide (TPR) repeat protein